MCDEGVIFIMKNVIQMSRSERKEEFAAFLKQQVKSAPRYISALEKGFSEAPVSGYESIYDITDPDILEDSSKTQSLRECSVFTRSTIGGTPGLAGLNWYISFLKDSRDSYYDFMNHFNIKSKDLFDWGMKAIIYPPVEKVEEEWENLKFRIFHDKEVMIRGYGRDAAGTKLYLGFYESLLNNYHIKKDPSNNNKPQNNLRKLTGYRRNKDIYNYQVSHIWGRTKNVFLFEAPWNVCYTPKIIDPFTGHETMGDLPRIFQESFLKFAQRKYRKYINDYNRIISSYDIEQSLLYYCKQSGINDKKFVADALSELSPIDLV